MHRQHSFLVHLVERTALAIPPPFAFLAHERSANIATENNRFRKPCLRTSGGSSTILIRHRGMDTDRIGFSSSFLFHVLLVFTVRTKSWLGTLSARRSHLLSTDAARPRVFKSILQYSQRQPLVLSFAYSSTVSSHPRVLSHRRHR